MDKSEVFQMRLTADDLAKLAEVEAWHHGMTRSAVMRLALVEMHRAVVRARTKRAEGEVLAAHRGEVAKAAAGSPSVRLPWSPELDEVERARRMSALPPLDDAALAVEVEALRAKRALLADSGVSSAHDRAPRRCRIPAPDACG